MGVSYMALGRLEIAYIQKENKLDLHHHYLQSAPLFAHAARLPFPSAFSSEHPLQISGNIWSGMARKGKSVLADGPQWISLTLN